jgi:hypothetical protein
MGFILNNKVSQGGVGDGGFFNLNVSSGPTYPSFYDSTLIQGFSFETANNVVTGSSDSLTFSNGSLVIAPVKVGIKSLSSGSTGSSGYGASTAALGCDEFHGSVAFWFNMGPAQSGVFAQGNSVGFNLGAINSGGQIYLNAYVGDSGNLVSGAINRLVWNHMAATWNADTGKFKLYLNGNLTGTDSGFSDSFGTTCDANLFYALGMSVYANMDEYYFWTRELTGSEITQLYTLGNANKTYPWAS